MIYIVPTIALTAITRKWVRAIRDNQAINEFCLTKYKKRPIIFLGINGKQPPTEADCPLIIVFPGSKAEGLSESEYHYTISIGWAIVNKAEVVNNGVVEHPGIAETDTLGQLIYQILAELNTSYPISHLSYDIEANDFFPQYPGRMDIILTVPVTMGTVLVY